MPYEPMTTRSGFTLGVEKIASQGVAEARTELENIPHFDAARDFQWVTAYGAAVPLVGGGNIGHDVGLVVSAVVDIPEVKAVLIGAGYQIGRCGRRLVGDDDDVFQADGRGVPGNGPAGRDLLAFRRPQGTSCARLQQFEFVDFQIAANHRHDELVVSLSPGLGPELTHEKYGFGRPGCRDTQKLGQFLDGLLVRRGHALLLERLFRFDLSAPKHGHFLVGGVAAFLAVQDGVLTLRSEIHELV